MRQSKGRQNEHYDFSTRISRVSNVKDIRKKKSKKSILKKLQKQAEKAWIEHCIKRDGRMCQVKKFFPVANLIHSNIIQVDHCFSRKNKWTFLLPENGTVICSTCNMLKGFNQGVVSKLIDEIVKEREGLKWHNLMIEGARKDPCLWWKDPSALEQKIKELKR